MTGGPRSEEYVTDIVKPGTRDHLALRRTELAAERTFLAYVRTAIAISAGAVGLPLLFGGHVFRVSAWVLAGGAVVVFVWGLRRLRSVKKWIERQEELEDREDVSDS